MLAVCSEEEVMRNSCGAWIEDVAAEAWEKDPLPSKPRVFLALSLASLS